MQTKSGAQIEQKPNANVIFSFVFFLYSWTESRIQDFIFLLSLRTPGEGEAKMHLLKPANVITSPKSYHGSLRQSACPHGAPPATNIQTQNKGSVLSRVLLVRTAFSRAVIKDCSGLVSSVCHSNYFFHSVSNFYFSVFFFLTSDPSLLPFI